MLKEVDIGSFTTAREGGALVVDVREGSEFVAGHVPGARWIPMGMLSGSLGALPRDRAFMVICASGNRSQVGAELPARAGYDAASVRGGTAAWASCGGGPAAGTD